MKKLIFIRHGRAEDSDPEISDFERSLTTKGKIIARLMARKLGEIEKSPGIIITSPAFRAIETAFIFASEFGINYEKIIVYNNLYYKMNYNYLTDILSLASEDNDLVTLFGHNPSFSEITDKLCRDGCDFVPKTGIVGLSFNVSSWLEIKQNTGKIEYFLKPEKAL